MKTVIESELSRAQEPRYSEQGIELLCVHSDLSFARFRGDIIVMCQPEHSLSDASWNDWIEWSISHRHRGVLVSTRGGSPSARQRSRYAEARRKIDAPRERVALLTDSAVMRGVMTAMAWMTGADAMAFAPNNLRGAITWLELGDCTAEVEALLARMHSAMAAAAS